MKKEYIGENRRRIELYVDYRINRDSNCERIEDVVSQQRGCPVEKALCVYSLTNPDLAIASIWGYNEKERIVVIGKIEEILMLEQEAYLTKPRRKPPKSKS